MGNWIENKEGASPTSREKEGMVYREQEAAASDLDGEKEAMHLAMWVVPVVVSFLRR